MTTLLWSRIAGPNQALHIARATFPMRDEPPLHDHDFFECFFIESGRGWHRRPTSRESLEPGQCVFIRPEHAHAFRSQRNQPLTLINLAFEPGAWRHFERRHSELLRKFGLWQKQRSPMEVRLSPFQLERLTELAGDVHAGERTCLDADYVLAGLVRLLRPQEAFGQGSTGMPEWLRQAVAVAREPGQLPANVPALVKSCGRTPEHVARSFQQHLKMTPTEWLTRERMRLACRLLGEGRLSVTEVAMECGMENLSHFHRCFKSVCGVTPLTYRKRSGLSIRGG